jgi:hypothetical protein
VYHSFAFLSTRGGSPCFSRALWYHSGKLLTNRTKTGLIFYSISNKITKKLAFPRRACYDNKKWEDFVCRGVALPFGKPEFFGKRRCSDVQKPTAAR